MEISWIHLVEDDPDDRLWTQRCLERAETLTNIRLTFSRDLEETAKVISEEGHPSIILLDLNLPGSRGQETYRAVKEMTESPIVILSGMMDEGLALGLVAKGAQDYLLKDGLRPPSLERAILLAVERDRLTKELSAAQQRLMEGEKLHALGRLVTAMAHEVKNPFGIIGLGAGVLEIRKNEIPEDLQEVPARISRAVTRGTKLIDRLLLFSRPSAEPTHEVDLRHAVTEALSHDYAWREGAQERFDFDLGSEVLPVEVDRSELVQILVNLLENAFDATGEEGRVRLETGISRGPVRDMAFSSLLNPKQDYAVLRVIDEGAGFQGDPSSYFEAFRSTKQTGSGTGLGLWITSMIASRRGGSIGLKNLPEGGAMAIWFVPLVKRPRVG
ncbi:MAG: ATP-binding protein [Verrucomicrobiota bacterium JB023]|nr:ATP-binding protein [Verrucomicrobiota bacterium JB023]